MMFFALLDQAEDIERACAEKIFCDHGKRIYAIAYGIVKNHHDAEDVLDSVMVSVMKNIDKFLDADEKSVAAQIYTYTKNEAINLYNKKKRKELNEVPTAEIEKDGTEAEAADESADIEKIVVQSETAKIVQENLGLLPEGYEDVLSMYFLYGYSYSEIAEILHVSENAVMIKVSRAKKKLLELAGEKLHERTEQ